MGVKAHIGNEAGDRPSLRVLYMYPDNRNILKVMDVVLTLPVSSCNGVCGRLSQSSMVQKP